MKTKLSLILGGLILLSQSAMAQTAVPLTVSATIPSATGLQLTVSTYNATTGTLVGTPSTTATTIPFGQLTLNTSLGIYLPANYYSVAIGATGGAGTPIVDVTYTEGANPNGSTNGLGYKTTATFVTANPTTSAETVSSIGKQRLIDLTGTVGQLASIPTGQYEKVYIGVWTGSTTAPADPSSGQPFSNADAPGTYTGTLTFTAVTL